MFARLIYYGVTQLRRSEQEVWLMPIGHLLDQWISTNNSQVSQILKEKYLLTMLSPPEYKLKECCDII